MTVKSKIINLESLSSHFNNNPGSNFFSHELEMSDSTEKFVHTLAQYIDFNECFAPAVLNLASRVAASTEFHDSNFFPPIASDRGAEIAAHIFFAAIDEYSKVPHRTLAQHTLVTTCNHFGLNHQIIRKLTQRTTYVHDVRGEVQSAYGFNEPSPDYQRMLFNIGVHVAAEGTAASEFKGLENYISFKHQKLATALEISHHHGLSAFHWIKVHTIVEENHFMRAIDAANLAITYRPSGLNDIEASDIIHSGIQHFQGLQEDFLRKVSSI
jgi:hypothetical protein